MNWENIWSNIISALIGSFAGAMLADRNEKKKEKRKEQKENNKNKAELIVKKGEFSNNEKIDINLLIAVFERNTDCSFNYSSNYNNKDEYVFKDYILTNIGKTPIEELEIVISDKRFASVINMKYVKEFIDNGFINYGYIWDKKIFPMQEIKIRLYFHKEKVITSAFSSAFIIQYRDSNGCYWEQAFFENDYNLYSPVKISYKEYRQNASIEKAMECFEKPWLW